MIVVTKKAFGGGVSFRLPIPPLRDDRAIMLAGWVLKVARMRPGKIEEGYSEKMGNDMITKFKGSE